MLSVDKILKGDDLNLLIYTCLITIIIFAYPLFKGIDSINEMQGFFKNWHKIIFKNTGQKMRYLNVAQRSIATTN